MLANIANNTSDGHAGHPRPPLDSSTVSFGGCSKPTQPRTGVAGVATWSSHWSYYVSPSIIYSLPLMPWALEGATTPATPAAGEAAWMHIGVGRAWAGAFLSARGLAEGVSEGPGRAPVVRRSCAGGAPVVGQSCAGRAPVVRRSCAGRALLQPTPTPREQF